LKTNQDY